MKRFLWLIFTLAVICEINTPKIVFADEDVYFIICNPTAIVNVRRMPNTHSEIVGCKYFGDKVITDGKEKNGFVHITNLFSEDTEGWVFKGLLVEDKPEAVEELAVIQADGRVAARKYANGKIKKWLQVGTEVKVYAISEVWCVTNYGYVKTEFIEIRKQEDES